MAPTRAAVITGTVTEVGSTTPLPMVSATCKPKKRKAMKLKKAAHPTAQRGDKTRVETTVAMELAASWNPLTKSKAKARPMTLQTTQASIMINVKRDVLKASR